MPDSRNVTIGRDAQGNVIVTGDNNVVYLIANPTPEHLARIERGDLQPADVPDAVPLPTLVLSISFADDTQAEWTVEARRPPEMEPISSRRLPTPWHSETRFADALNGFWQLSRKVLDNEDEKRRLEGQAALLGDALAAVLDEAGRALLTARHGPPPPFLIIESAHDLVLALPWELLRLENAFAVREGKLDVARCASICGQPAELAAPTEPLRLLVNVSAPIDTPSIDTENESYQITCALPDPIKLVINELGEVDDLVAGLCADPPPSGVHFSGHGEPGKLVFENAYGEGAPVSVADLLAPIRAHADSLPRFFYLACCHGGDAPSLTRDGDVTSAATALHREGVPQVVGYFGPVYDVLSTWASTAFYRQIALGRRTRDAVRVARLAMTRPLAEDVQHVMRDAGTFGDAGSVPFGWAQLVLYHRGRDHPLGTRVADLKPGQQAVETTLRTAEERYPGARTKVLSAGFIGRRKELHDLRRRIRAGRPVHVVTGLGGLGKSTFCLEGVRLYERAGWQPLALWCSSVENDPDPVAGLLRQVEEVGRPVLGAAWDQVLASADRAAADAGGGQRASARLVGLFGILAEHAARPILLYLDNLESLQAGPKTADPDAVGTWRDDECAQIWRELRALAEARPNRFALIASGRYQHGDLAGVVPFGRLPRDAVWRLMGWFPDLRRLSSPSRARLVERLAGHARSVEFLDALVKQALNRWEDDNGLLEDVRAAAIRDRDGLDAWGQREWDEIVSPILPGLQNDLSTDLLFGELWQTLNPAERDTLVRATVLRIPADRNLMAALHDPPEAGNAAISRLRDLSLLTEFEIRTDAGPERRYEVHPSVAELVLLSTTDGDRLRNDGHHRAGVHLEETAASSQYVEVHLEAAYHLDAVGEADRALDLLGPYAVWLAEQGRYFDSRLVLGLLTSVDRLSDRSKGRLLSIAGSNSVGLGNLSEALESHRASMAIRERLAEADPQNAGWQRDLSVSQEKIGDVLVSQGNLSEALESYRASMAIAQRLAEADPQNAGWQRDLSVSHNNVGDVLLSQGNLSEALESYRASMAIAQRLAEADPRNAGWQRDLSVSHNKVGDILVSQGSLSEALESYRASMVIAQRLAEADPRNAGCQYDVGTAHDRIGNVLVLQGNLSDGLKSYRASMAIAERLTSADPTNTGWQRVVSVSHNKVGDILVSQGNLSEALKSYRASMAIRERLAEADPRNAGWQRDLSVSQVRIGDVLVSQGNLSEALESYRASMAIRESLAEADPRNAGWQRDLSVSHKKIGNLLREQGNLPHALVSYRADLDIAERLALSDPQNAGWQRDLAVSLIRTGELMAQSEDYAEEGAGMFARGADLLLHLADRGVLPASDGPFVEALRKMAESLGGET